jgi:transposase-like protein
MVEDVEVMAAAGLTDVEIAEKFGVHFVCIYRWKKKHPEFKAAIERGKAQWDDDVEMSLAQRAMGYKGTEQKVVMVDGRPEVITIEKEYPPDPTAMIFWLKNRRPEQWRDKHEVEQKGDITLHFDDKDKDL